LLFVGVLFTYYFLARFEERRMLTIDPAYADYMKRTGIFLPGNPGGHVYRLLFGRIRDQKLAHYLASSVSLALLLLSGLAVRAYTLQHISHTSETANIEIVSVYPMSSGEMLQVTALALANSSVEEALRREGDVT